jgi:hypothetical protein
MKSEHIYINILLHAFIYKHSRTFLNILWNVRECSTSRIFHNIMFCPMLIICPFYSILLHTPSLLKCIILTVITIYINYSFHTIYLYDEMKYVCIVYIYTMYCLLCLLLYIVCYLLYSISPRLYNKVMKFCFICVCVNYGFSFSYS